MFDTFSTTDISEFVFIKIRYIPLDHSGNLWPPNIKEVHVSQLAQTLAMRKNVWQFGSLPNLQPIGYINEAWDPLSLGICHSNFKWVIFKHISVNDILSISLEIKLRWMPQDFIDG